MDAERAARVRMFALELLRDAREGAADEHFGRIYDSTANRFRREICLHVYKHV